MVLNHFRYLWLALSVAYIALLPQFYYVFDAGNRLEMGWGRVHHASIIVAIIVLGVTWWLAYTLFSHLGRRLRLVKHLLPFIAAWVLFVILVRTLVSLADRSDAVSSALMAWLGHPAAKLIYYLLVPGILVYTLRFRLVHSIRNIYYLLSPLLPLVVLVPLTWTVHHDAHGSVDPTQSVTETADTEPPPLILLFLFDAWSYELTFPEGRLLPSLPHIGRLLADSAVYHQAYTPGIVTYQSLPLLYYPDSEKFLNVEDNREFVHGVLKGGDPITDPSIFDLVPEHWKTYAYGFHESVLLVEGKADQVVWVREHACRQYFGEETWRLLATQLGPLRALGMRPQEWLQCDLCDIAHDMPHDMPTWKWKEPLKWALSTTWIHEEALRIIKNHAKPAFAVFHYCLPHDPYIWESDGMKRRITADMLDNHTTSNYYNNLKYLDVLVGDLLQALEEQGRYDSTMLIMLSDHGWQYEGARRHIPIIIKWPGQHEREDIHEVVSYGAIVGEIESMVEVWRGD